MRKLWIVSDDGTSQRPLNPRAYQHMCDQAMEAAARALRSNPDLDVATRGQLTRLINPEAPVSLTDLNAAFAQMGKPFRLIEATARTPCGREARMKRHASERPREHALAAARAYPPAPPASDATRPSCCAVRPPAR